MIQTIKRILFRLLGRAVYLRMISRLYFLAYRSGWLRRNDNYEFHYFVRHLVKSGDYVIDIGANLGYYSVLFSELAGPEGRVWSVEPVPLYQQILKENLGGRENVEVVPYALGEETGTAQMGIPAGDQPYRHGLTRILTGEQGKAPAAAFEVEIRDPSTLFDHLGRLDYIKCDVEGYEDKVLPPMQPLIRRFRPLVQVELSAGNRPGIFNLFHAERYRAYALRNQRLDLLKDPHQPAPGDVLFVPEEKDGELKMWMKGG
jgi:FkbM family methyltransferase